MSFPEKIVNHWQRFKIVSTFKNEGVHFKPTKTLESTQLYIQETSTKEHF